MNCKLLWDGKMTNCKFYRSMLLYIDHFAYILHFNVVSVPFCYKETQSEGTFNIKLKTEVPDAKIHATLTSEWPKSTLFNAWTNYQLRKGSLKSDLFYTRMRN